ncbi:MAG TPA: excisionase family DNA-binding protein [Bryobacteraceae bacterium]|nr:excisionase family DNA-binding protein [Bryobacteraceae bacterium]
MRSTLAKEGSIERRTYSVPEASAVSGLGITAIYRGVKDGRIPHIRAGRRICIPRFAFHQWIDTAGGQVFGGPHIG